MWHGVGTILFPHRLGMSSAVLTAFSHVLILGPIKSLLFWWSLGFCFFWEGGTVCLFTFSWASLPVRKRIAKAANSQPIDNWKGRSESLKPWELLGSWQWQRTQKWQVFGATVQNPAGCQDRQKRSFHSTGRAAGTETAVTLKQHWQ